MKKIIFIAMLTFYGFTQAQVTFKPGLRGGLNFAHFTKGDDNNYYYSSSYYGNKNSIDFSSKTDFYIGFYGALHLTKYYTLQPEIDYSRQGSNSEIVYQTYNTNGSVSTIDIVSKKFDVSYLNINILNKFTFSDKFNIHIGPTLDFVVEENFNTESDVDLAFVLGAGFNFTSNFGIEARVKKGIVPVFDSYDTHTNVVFSLGATYTFDLK